MSGVTSVLTEQQSDLRDAVADLLAKRSPEAQVRRLMSEDTGHDPGLWAELAAMGLLGLIIPTEFGGAGAGATDLAVGPSRWAGC